MPTNLRVRVIDSGNSQVARFNTTIDYGAAGQVVSQRLPGGKGGQLGETITYSYDSRTGRPTAASVNEGVGQIAGNIELNEFGQLLSMDNLSGVKRGYTYEQGTGRLLQVQAGTDTANVLNLSYSYDPNGNVTTLTDATNAGQQTCYGYDHVQRLTSAATSGFGTCGTAGQTVGAGGFEHAYSYDAIGNMTSYGTADRAYTYDPNRPHAVVSIANPQDPAQGDWTYAYDDGGNVTQRQVEGWDQTFSYDQQQRVVQIDDVAINGVGNTATTTFAYTAGDSRVVRDTDEAQTFYAFGVYEYEIDKATDARTERSTYSVAGERVAVREQVTNPASDELTWTFSDNLGSASGFLNETTGETGAQRYYPFGHQRVASASDINPTDHGYTGQIRDGATGVYFYNARYYDQHTGRFLAADTIIPNPANPADLNRYSYVRNNPINFNDPTGHCPSNTTCYEDALAWRNVAQGQSTFSSGTYNMFLEAFQSGEDPQNSIDFFANTVADPQSRNLWTADYLSSADDRGQVRAFWEAYFGLLADGFVPESQSMATVVDQFFLGASILGRTDGSVGATTHEFIPSYAVSVYVATSNGQAVYVGITSQKLSARQAQHRRAAGRGNWQLHEIASYSGKGARLSATTLEMHLHDANPRFENKIDPLGRNTTSSARATARAQAINTSNPTSSFGGQNSAQRSAMRTLQTSAALNTR